MRHRAKHRCIALLGAGLIAAAPMMALAQDAKPDAKPNGATASLRPTGPVTVTADRGEWVDGGPMRYSGHVALRSDTLSLDGDTLELRQLGDGRFEARIHGAPARLDHAGVPDTRGASAVPVKAEAKQLFYDSRSGIVELTGSANLLRGSDEVHGESIRYDVGARRVQAEGGSGGQVRIVIQPPSQNDDKKPSP